MSEQPVKNEISDTGELKRVESKGRHRWLLKAGVSLAAVLVAGHFLAGTILRNASESGRGAVTRHAIAAPQQRYTIKVPAHFISFVGFHLRAGSLLV